MSFKLDLSQHGWCTPTILTAFLGLLGVIVLTSQIMSEKDEKQRRARLIALLTKALWTVALVALLYWLCQNNRTEASWWIFGILYILPVALLFVILAGYAFSCKRKSQTAILL